MEQTDFFSQNQEPGSGERQMCRSCKTVSEPGDTFCRNCGLPFALDRESRERIFSEKRKDAEKQIRNLGWLSAPLILYQIGMGIWLPIRIFMNGMFSPFNLIYTAFLWGAAFWTWKRPFWSGIVLLALYLIFYTSGKETGLLENWFSHGLYPLLVLLSFAGGLFKNIVKKQM